MSVPIIPAGKPYPHVEASPRIEVALEQMALAGVMGERAWLDAEIRRREALIEVGAIVATIDDPRLVP